MGRSSPQPTRPHPEPGEPPRAAHLLSRRRWFLRGIICLTAAILLVSVLDHFGAFHGRRLLRAIGLGGYPGDDWATYDQKDFLVRRAIDGQSLEITRPGQNSTTIVGLYGIDAPDLGLPSDSPLEYWAEQAKAELALRAEGRTVTLRLDATQTRDGSGRLQAYLYLSDSDMLNLGLVKDGHAYSDRRCRHSFAGQFDAAEGEARKKARGLWRDLKDDQMPAWRKEWLGTQGGRKSASP